LVSPLRSEIPPHPYVQPFREHVSGLSYDGRTISLEIMYD
jgi:hypothetical protein